MFLFYKLSILLPIHFYLSGNMDVLPSSRQKNLHFCLAIFNSKKLQTLIFSTSNSYCENIAVRFHERHYSKIPDIEALFNISP